MFNINWIYIIKALLPPFYRHPKWIATLSTIFKPIIQLYDDFITYRTTLLDEINYSSIIVYFEDLLNLKIGEGIYITHPVQIFKFIYNKAEDKAETYLYNKSEMSDKTYLFNRSELSINQPDFIVNVPNTLSNKENQLKALIEKYKICGTSYKINYYEST